MEDAGACGGGLVLGVMERKGRGSSTFFMVEARVEYCFNCARGHWYLNKRGSWWATRFREATC